MMKKKVLKILPLIAIILTLCIGKTHAQRLLIGAKGGINYGSIATNTTYYELKSGSSSGLYFEFIPGSFPLSLALETNYLTYGAEEIEEALIFDEAEILNNYLFNQYYKSTNISFTAIDVPMLIKLNLHLKAGVSASLYGGSSFTYILNANAIQEYEMIIDQTTVSNFDITERVAESAYTGIVGIGGIFDIDPLALTFDVRYRIGLTDLNNYYGKADFKSHSVHVMLGLAYIIE